VHTNIPHQTYTGLPPPNTSRRLETHKTSSSSLACPSHAPPSVLLRDRPDVFSDRGIRGVEVDRVAHEVHRRAHAAVGADEVAGFEHSWVVWGAFVDGGPDGYHELDAEGPYASLNMRFYDYLNRELPLHLPKFLLHPFQLPNVAALLLVGQGPEMRQSTPASCLTYSGECQGPDCQPQLPHLQARW
jgi:hypothetical protein